ncbi:MAG: Ig-like domain-containing protein [Oscillospiraceae bacterium]|nr:Ig-like domain-containing protein [Oscillospiraceae bacterium]
MFCTKCGAQMPESVTFCTECGAPMNRPQAQQQGGFAPVQQPRSPMGQQTIPDDMVSPDYGDTYVDAYDPVYDAPVAVKKKKSAAPLVALIVVLALLIAAICVVAFVPSVHDALFGAKELRFDDSSLELAVGDRLDLAGRMELGGRDAEDLKWTSSDRAVAEVKDGVVTALADGTCTITAEDGEASDSVTLTVYTPQLRFASQQASLEVGGTLALGGTVTSTHIDPATLTWTSSDSSVCSVDGQGTVSALKAGAAVITVRSGDLSDSMTVTVTEKPAEQTPAPVAPSPDGYVDVDAALKQIRSWYYTPGSGDVRREVSAGENGWALGRQYLYHNGEMVFAFLYGGGEEHRLYFQNGRLIHVIETDRSEYSGDALTPFLAMADQAKSDAAYYAP